MVTRRTRLRQLLLLPLDETTEAMAYLLAVFVVRYHLRVHAVVFLSNHYHLVVTDPLGLITDFTRDFHAFVARHVNAIYGEFESVWSRTQTHLLRLENDAAILDKIGYTMANPVQSCLVSEGSEWPGLRCAWPAPPMVIKRPEGFLDIANPDCKWPEQITLEMSRPPGHDELSDAELAEAIALDIAQKEEDARRQAADEGIGFLGAHAILSQSRHARPTTREPHFDIAPRVACKDPAARVERLRYNQHWLELYDVALSGWRAGDRDVVFPYGTNKMRRCHGVKVAPRPTSGPAAPPG